MLRITEAIINYNRKTKEEEWMTQKLLSSLVIPTKKGESEEQASHRKINFMSRLTRGKMKSCDFKIILLIASVLKVDPNYLLGWDDWQEEFKTKKTIAEKNHLKNR